MPNKYFVMKDKIRGKTILITGGTGSFGNTVVGKLLDLKPKRVIIFSRDEKKQYDMRNSNSNPVLKFIIGDVRDSEAVSKVVEGVDYIFHAAALKQVPTCEFFPMEAVKTNILGAYNVINAATFYKVKKVVVLSTDKAAYPINVVGMSKAMMEKVMIAESKTLVTFRKKGTVLCGVRYGNVLYTRGSVIPYFVNLIKQKERLSVTSLNMTRFLLSLDDAVGLVLYALANGRNGYIYVRKSPACTLEILVKAICKIFNYEIGYKEVGIRAGEKMHETLVTEEEMVRAVNTRDYYAIPPESQDLDYNKYFLKGKVDNEENLRRFTSENTIRLNLQQTIDLLKSLPEINQEIKNIKK